MIQIGSFGPVSAHKHLLRFSSTITEAEEGIYFCCVPNGPCGKSSLASTIVRISSKPIQ